MTIEARLTVATQLVREAGDLAAGFFARCATLTRETKGPQELRQYRRPRGRDADPHAPGRGLSSGWFSREGERGRGGRALLGRRSD